MRFETEHDAIDYILRTRRNLVGRVRGLDEHTRDITPTRQLLLAAGLPEKQREYATITGSRGKGSTTAIMAHLLQTLGHKTGMLTGPHLVKWQERIRINGHMIPVADFLRILSDLSPFIDQVEATLTDQQYLSPQGIFLAMALRWFDEQSVEVAVLEVGRGGRYDDVSLAPNKLALFTPIILEHIHYLGHSLERIAWHKAGIIKPNSYVYSVPQDPIVLEVLQQEADSHSAEFSWLSYQDMGQYLGEGPDRLRMRLHRYGELTLSLRGRFQVDNASLAVQGVGNIHGRLQGISHGSPEYVERIRAGLASVRWPGRVQKLDDSPLIFIDGAITVESARGFVESVRGELRPPVVAIVGVPVDRDYKGVYEVMAGVSDGLVLTENHINPNTRYPDTETALNVARQHCPDVEYARALPEALEMARKRTGDSGSILLAGSQMLVGEALQLWGYSFDTL